MYKNFKIIKHTDEFKTLEQIDFFRFKKQDLGMNVFQDPIYQSALKKNKKLGYWLSGIFDLGLYFEKKKTSQQQLKIP